MKLVNETHKILNDDSIGVTATTVRIPMVGGHGQAVNIEFEKDFGVARVQLLEKYTQGRSPRRPFQQCYHAHAAEGKGLCFVGRIRRDTSHPNAVNMWIVADNIEKAAGLPFKSRNI